MDITSAIQHTSEQILEIAKLRVKEKLSNERLLLLNLIEQTTDPKNKESLIEFYKSSKYDEIVLDKKKLDNDIKDSPTTISNRFVYQYNPNDLKTPIKTYNSLREAARSLNNPCYYDYHIRNASNTSTLFAGYRWYYMDGEEDKQPDELPETKTEETKKRNNGLIVQVNKEKTGIVAVYSNQRDAEKATNISNSQISTGITSGKIRNGFYWMLYEECPDDLKKTYKGELPEVKRVSTSSKRVQRIDPFTNKVLETYSCMQDVCNAFNCCHKSIKKAHDSGDIFKNFKWNIVVVE